jgi:hypothetical protein
LAVDPRKSAESDADTRIAPDPFIVVLPALSALAAVTSIAAVNWSAQDKTPDRSKSRRKASSALRDLESCCVGLAEIFKRFQRMRDLFGGAGGAATAPMKFGVHGPRVSPEQSRQYQQLMNDTASMLVLAAQNAFDVMAAVEDGELSPPEDVFYAFGDAQEELNRLMQERVSLRVAVDRGAVVSLRLVELVRQFKAYKTD